MVKVADTQIKNIGFNTSVETGTRVRNSGEALAGIVTTAIGVKRGMEKAQNEQDRLDSKGSTLALNDAKIKYQEGFNNYDWQDPSKPTSSEWMDFHEKMRGETTELYNLMVDEDRQKYDLFYAQKDGETSKLIHGEAVVGAQNLLQASLPNLTSLEEGYKLVDSLDGLVTKADFLKMVSDQAESFLETDALNGMTSDQLSKMFPVMNEIKDPAIGTKWKQHIVALKKKEATEAAILSGQNAEVAATANGVSGKGSKGGGKAIAQGLVDKRIAAGDLEGAIDIATNNGLKINLFESVADTMFQTAKTDISMAIDKMALFKKTKNVYGYSTKVRKEFEALDIIATVNNLDLNTEEGFSSAINIYDGIKESEAQFKASGQKGSQYKVLTEDEITDVADGFWFRDLSDNEKKYIVPRANELLRFTGGDAEKAAQIAVDEFEEFDNADNEGISGAIYDKPYGMIFKDTERQTVDQQIEGVEIIKKFYSADNDADDVEMEYEGGDRWRVKQDGRPDMVLTVSQMNNALKQQEVFENAMKSIDAVVSESDILHGDRLRDRQITEDTKIIKNEISKYEKSFEERTGIKVTPKMKIELKRKLVPLLKQRMLEQDALARENMRRESQGLELKPDKNGYTTRVKQKGMVNQGNLDINTPIAMVQNEDGSVSTVRTIGVNIDGKETVIPTVHPDGHIMTDKEAVEHFKKTGEHFGQFDTVDNAQRFARSLHDRQEESVYLMKEKERKDKFTKEYKKKNPNATDGAIIAAYNNSQEFVEGYQYAKAPKVGREFTLAGYIDTILQDANDREGDEDDGVTHFTPDTLRKPKGQGMKNGQGKKVGVEIAPNDEIMNSILDAELGGKEFKEGVLHAGQETITKNNPNGDLNTTNYGVVITDFPKKKGETDREHANRYYTKKVKPVLEKVKGIDTASNEVIIGLSRLVWNKGNIIKGLDLTDAKKTTETLLDVTTTGGKHSNGVINRTIADYSMIAKAAGLPEVAQVRTTQPKGGKYRIQYLDANGKIIHDDARMTTTARGSRIKGGKTYNVVNNVLQIN